MQLLPLPGLISTVMEMGSGSAAASTTAMIAEPIPAPVVAIVQTKGAPSGRSTIPSALQSTPPGGAKALVAAAIACKSATPTPPDEIPMTLGGSSARIAATVSAKLGPGYGVEPGSPGR